MADEKDDDLDMLTEEERAAFNAEEGEDIDGSASLTGEDTREWVDNGWGAASGQADERPGENTTEAAEGGDDTAQAAAGEDAAPAAEAKEEPARRADPAPVDTSEIDRHLEDLRQQESALLDKYDDGDLSRDELNAQRAEISKQADAAIAQRAIAEQRITDEMERWNGAVDEYLRDYGDLKSDGIVSAFDTEVRAVTSNPAFANRSDKEQLAIAHKRLLATAEDMGLTGVPPIKGTEKPKQEAKPEQPAKAADPRGDDLRTPPPTLARVPASEISDTGNSKYASLQRVVESGTPEEVEHAMSQLSDEERDTFSSMNI